MSMNANVEQAPSVSDVGKSGGSAVPTGEKKLPKIDTVKSLNPVQEAIHNCRYAFGMALLFSFGVNALMLITPLYSLQVLDRVIGSGSKETLVMLSMIIACAYFAYTLLQIARSFTMIRIGEWLDTSMSPLLMSHAVSSAARRTGGAGASQVLRDFQTVKTFLTSTGLNTFMDMPWVIIYIIAIFMIHKYLGYLTIVGGCVIVFLAFVNAAATNKTLGEANEYSIRSLNQAEIANRNAESIEAMGMMKNVVANWQQFNTAALSKQSEASYRNGIVSNTSRFLRNLLQMAVTGIGAYVVVTTRSQEMTTGGMIASSILVGRALAPFDNAIELWKTVTSTAKSYARINEVFKVSTLRDEAMPITNVTGALTVEGVYFAHPTNKPQAYGDKPKYTLIDVNFDLNPGEALAIIGHSACGKSTLAKVLSGVWKTAGGTVRLDGGETFKWNREDFGKHIGYLPQGIELFGGTIKQNIARMSDEIDPQKVEEAAILAGAHEMILKLENGYETDIGVGGTNLSGGQRQRIGLARAFYGNPKLIILDEPNSNLDEAGEAALANAISQSKARGITTIIISHRPSVLSSVDKILMMKDGGVMAFGTVEEVMKKIELLRSGTIHIK